MRGGVKMIDATMIEPIVTMITDSIAVLLPVGITIMGLMIGVSLVPRIVYKFF